MNFSASKHYYIHNFGINYEPIFFSNRNKKYFIKKIHTYITPYAQVISIKLAENQFHILIKVRDNYSGVALNHNIGIMLRSYTRAINKERFRIGSLFCRHTKAFGKLSDIPKRLRAFIKPFTQYFKLGKLVNFPKTVKVFFDFLKLEKNHYQQDNISYNEIFMHPFHLINGS